MKKWIQTVIIIDFVFSLVSCQTFFFCHFTEACNCPPQGKGAAHLWNKFIMYMHQPRCSREMHGRLQRVANRIVKLFHNVITAQQGKMHPRFRCSFSSYKYDNPINHLR